MVRTRFAPSPTGFLHVGGARTALFSWLYARHCGGAFVLRIEDTDTERSTAEASAAIVESMQWLGLNWDEGPFYQSERRGRYREVIARLLDQGQAYCCCCSRERLEEVRAAQLRAGLKPRYDGHCREAGLTPAPGTEYVVRFRNPQEGEVRFDDIIKGHMRFDNAELDDFIIQRSDGSPTYNFCVVVDDLDMGITHVIRGDDHLNNTPRQINLYQALGAAVPQFCHVAMILGEDGTKLSKRHGAVGVMQYREEGFLPAALVNYLLRLGWSHGDQEIFSRQEMIGLFSLEGLSGSASAFSRRKLCWLNAQYMKAMPPQELGAELAWHLRRLGLDPAHGPDPAAAAQHYAGRVQTLADMAQRVRCYYEEPEGYDAAGVAKWITPRAPQLLEQAAQVLEALPDFSAPVIEERLTALAGELQVGMAQLGQPLRIAVTGGPSSPGIGATLELTGRERALRRIRRAAEHFRDPAA